MYRYITKALSSEVTVLAILFHTVQGNCIFILKIIILSVRSSCPKLAFSTIQDTCSILLDSYYCTLYDVTHLMSDNFSCNYKLYMYNNY